MIASSQPFPALAPFTDVTRRALGAAGEMEVIRALQSSGYLVDAPHKRLQGDLIAYEGEPENDCYPAWYSVEVKAARFSGTGYRFSLVRRNARGGYKTCHRGADFVIALCVLRAGAAVPFVIPVDRIRDLTMLAISGRDPYAYSGKWSQYRQKMHELRLTP